MGFKVFAAPACYDGVPLADTLVLQANHHMGHRSNRGIVSVTFSEMFDGLYNVLWNTPKVLTILCVIAAALISCLFGIYQFNLWQIRT